MFPANIVQATMQQVQTDYMLNETNKEVLGYKLVYKDGTNIFGSLFF